MVKSGIDLNLKIFLYIKEEDVFLQMWGEFDIDYFIKLFLGYITSGREFLFCYIFKCLGFKLVLKRYVNRFQMVERQKERIYFDCIIIKVGLNRIYRV